MSPENTALLGPILSHWGAEEEVKTWSNEANFTVISVVKCRFGNRISICRQLRG